MRSVAPLVVKLFRCTLVCLVATTFALSAAAPEAAASGAVIYRCVLSGAQEVPANASTAIGGGEFRIDPAANTVDYRIVFTGLVGAETAAHIHGPADPGLNAGIMTGLPAGNPKVGTWNYLEVQEADILSGKTYVNIHSTAFAGGEIRGQIVPLVAELDGGQEVPAVATPARGWGTFTIDLLANQLSYHIVVSGLTGVETAAHIHGAATHGVNAGVRHGLPLGSPKIGTWNYTDAQEADIVAGRSYVNVHTNVFPGGEIRGQIVPIVAPIDGRQEVPPNPSPGAGIGLFAIDEAADVLSYDIRFSGLLGAETAAHIHGYAPPGANAGIVTGLPLGPRKLGTWNYPAGDEASIVAGRSYVNIHSAAFPGGEIRGQIEGFDCPIATFAPEWVDAGPGLRATIGPNPFAARTTVRFDLSRVSDVRLSVVDAAGRRVRSLFSGRLDRGPHGIAWDGRDAVGAPVAGGVYFYRLETSEGTASGSMTVVQ